MRTMRKVILLAVVLGIASAVRAEDSYLYWMVDVDAATEYAVSRGYAFDENLSAKVRVLGNDAPADIYLPLLYKDGYLIGDSVGYPAIRDAWDNYGAFWASLGNMQSGYCREGYSYVVELFYDSSWIGQSAELSYNEAVTGNLISFSKMSPPTGLWMPAPYAVPEPNSALLMLLGCAVLALRRRRSGRSDSFSASEGGCET